MPLDQSHHFDHCTYSFNAAIRLDQQGLSGDSYYSVMNLPAGQGLEDIREHAKNRSLERPAQFFKWFQRVAARRHNRIFADR